MIATYLVYCYLKDGIDADTAMIFFNERRTKDGKGLNRACHMRYVRYFESMLRNNIDLNVTVTLKRIKMYTAPE